MKTSLKANLLKHLIAKKEEGGFTLIELLVVIIIIGILSAIALPSFLNQANRARQSEAQTYVGSVNRAQQAFYLENNEFASEDSQRNDFADSSEALAALGLGISEATDNYVYEIVGTDPSEAVSAWALPSNDGANQDPSSALLGFIGGTAIASTTGLVGGEATTVAILCRSDQTPVQNGGALTFAEVESDGTTTPECPDDFTSIN